MNSNAILNRIEVLFYSSLISCMGGVNKFRTHLDNLTNTPKQVTPQIDVSIPDAVADPVQRSVAVNWRSLGQSLVANIIWIVLGFAAGILMGMLNPR